MKQLTSDIKTGVVRYWPSVEMQLATYVLDDTDAALDLEEEGKT